MLREDLLREDGPTPLRLAHERAAANRRQSPTPSAEALAPLMPYVAAGDLSADDPMTQEMIALYFDKLAKGWSR